MTDIELLPSSVAAFVEALKGERGSLDAWLEVNNEREVRAHVEAYARANVAHATAAKDAEIEALRAEVAAWRELSDHVRAGACNAIWPDRYTSPSTARVAKALRDLQAEVERLERDGIDGWKQSARNRARAERLAEALRMMVENADDLVAYRHDEDDIGDRPCCQVASYEPHADHCPTHIARAALRDHDQEGKE